VCDTPLARLVHASYTPATRLFHACYTPLTRLLLLQQQDTLSRQKGRIARESERRGRGGGGGEKEGGGGGSVTAV
jgi:hypothetical protein